MKLDEKTVRKAVIKWLSRQGYNRYLAEKETQEHGVDIKVRHFKYPIYYLVEVKGDPNEKNYKNPSAGREVAFIYAVGQITTRMKFKAKYKYALGFPITYRDKVLRRLPWILCKKLNLNVLLVNKDLKIENITWKELKAHQRYIESID